MKPFENIVGKRENSGNQHFLLFPQCFLSIPIRISVFKLQLFLSSAKAYNLDQSKRLSFGKEFKPCGKDILESFFCRQMKTVALVVFVVALVSSDVHGLAVKEFPSTDGDIAEKPLVSRISSFSDNVSHLLSIFTIAVF